ncbi:hypothetical protein ED733_005329 [Metarhizium rileyi]|uniref:Tat pathway signal sequence n=1 Tax=Metarhizium rileyi (strain RCEF 4871) TaxID=1649241 RepID=A0A5C6GER6_METRR|nr:hypothetical protein ED733_005329 [Metarhizium rileyi]
MVSQVRTSTHRYTIRECSNGLYNPGALPKIPLRVPQKSSRQSLGPSAQRVSHVPSSSSSASTSLGNLSLPLKADSSTEDLSKEDGLILQEKKEADEQYWFAQRKQSRRFLVIVGIVTLVVLSGLALGLTLGLRDKVFTRGSQVDNDDDSPPSLPVGVFSVHTSLRQVETDCTSDSTTWGCDPMASDGPSVFLWNISRLNQHTYTVTSTEDSFGPGFANISMKMHDYNKPTERFEFALLMNKIVSPSDAESLSGSAAKCTYENVIFEATLYTRKRGDATVKGSANHVENAAWPGDVEISHFINSTVGQPVCEDAMSHPLADINAGQGTCQCRYSNTDRPVTG